MGAFFYVSDMKGVLIQDGLLYIDGCVMLGYIQGNLPLGTAIYIVNLVNIVNFVTFM